MLTSAAGCGVGLIISTIAILQGRSLFTAVGAGVGVCMGSVLFWLQKRRARFALSQVTISFAGTELLFVVNDNYRKAAWRLFVETMTRVATQPLSRDHGTVREALTSLHSLFQTTRDLLKEMEPTPTNDGNTVEMLALEMLNANIRPFLARWHPSLAVHEKANPDFDEHNWLHGQQCRDDLEDLRTRLVNYARSFGQLANVQQLDRFFDSRIAR